MKSIYATLLVTMGLLCSSVVTAGEYDSQSFVWNSSSRGSRSLDLRTEVTRTEYRQVRVPYTERVCRMETRYRRECRQEPPTRQCRTETRRVCENRPVCRVVNGRRVCQNRQVCRDVPRQVCQTVPGRSVCRDVPYQERICHDETRYRYESRPVTVVDRETNARLRFDFDNDSGEYVSAHINVDLGRDILGVTVSDRSDRRQVILGTYDERRMPRGRNLDIDADARLRFVSEEVFFAPISQNAYERPYRGDGILVMELPLFNETEQVVPHLRIEAAGRVLIDRELGVMDWAQRRDDQNSLVRMDLRALLGAEYDRYRGQQVRVEFKLRVSARPGERVFNRQDFGRFESDPTLFSISL